MTHEEARALEAELEAEMRPQPNECSWARINPIFGDKRLLMDNRKVPEWLSAAYRSGSDG